MAGFYPLIYSITFIFFSKDSIEFWRALNLLIPGLWAGLTRHPIDLNECKSLIYMNSIQICPHFNWLQTCFVCTCFARSSNVLQLTIILFHSISWSAPIYWLLERSVWSEQQREEGQAVVQKRESHLKMTLFRFSDFCSVGLEQRMWGRELPGAGFREQNSGSTNFSH